MHNDLQQISNKKERQGVKISLSKTHSNHEVAKSHSSYDDDTCTFVKLDEEINTHKLEEGFLC